MNKPFYTILFFIFSLSHLWAVEWSQVRPIFINNCIDCHSQYLTGDARSGAPDNINFDNYELTRPNAQAALDAAAPQTGDPIMPKDRPALSDSDQALLQEWGDKGFSSDPTVQVTSNTEYAQIGDLIEFDASGSTEADSLPLSYSWTQVLGTSATLSDINAPILSFNAPNVSATGELLTFEVTVSSNNGSQSEIASVTVTDPLGNQLPTANAGADQIVSFSTNVFLDGTESTDDTVINNYEWTILSGDLVTLSDPLSSKPSYLSPKTGTNTVFELTVSDEFDLRTRDQVIITYTQSTNINNLEDEIDTTEYTPINGQFVESQNNGSGGCLLRFSHYKK